MSEQGEPETRGFPTKEELLVLADYWEERGDPRAEIARKIDEPDEESEVFRLLTESDQHEAACVFAERALMRERGAGRNPDARLWSVLEAKRAWMRGEITDDHLRTKHGAAWIAVEVAERASQAARLAGDVTKWASVAGRDAAWAAHGAAQAASVTVGETAWEEGETAWEMVSLVADLAAMERAHSAEHEAERDGIENRGLEEQIAECEWHADWTMKRAWGGERPGTQN